MIKLIISLLFLTQTYAQTPDNTEVDPQVMEAILDASKASADPDADPLENMDVNKTSMQIKADEKPVEIKKPVKAETFNKNTIKRVLSEEESEMIRMWEQEQALKDSKNNSSDEDIKESKAIYIPAPVEAMDPDGILLERDSSKVVTKRMGANDSMNIKICYNSGLSIAFDDDIEDTLQRVILDDRIFFDAQEFENQRGVYIRLKRPIPDGKNWESAIRLVRQSDDKTYLFNLIGLPCPPQGLTPFPKVLYIRDHYGLLSHSSKILTPEDTIISLSKGLPRIQKNRIRFYDMVASSSSNWVVFGVEVQYPNASNKKTIPKMIVLDNHQIQTIGSKLEYLPLHSEKATEVRGVPTLRFKLSININKNYVLKSRYIHVMFLDEESGHYQYIRIDSLNYYLSLIRRGFEL